MESGLVVGANYFCNSTFLNRSRFSNQDKIDYMVYGDMDDKLTYEDINQSNLKEMGKQELFEKFRFVILLPGCSYENANQVAERIIADFRADASKNRYVWVEVGINEVEPSGQFHEIDVKKNVG